MTYVHYDPNILNHTISANILRKLDIANSFVVKHTFHSFTHELQLLTCKFKIITCTLNLVTGTFSLITGIFMS